MHWLVFILVSILTVLVNVVFLRNIETSFHAVIIFNSGMLVGYGLMFLFYGRRRKSTLNVWLPIKFKMKSVLLRMAVLGLCLAGFPLAYELSQATECHAFLVYGKGAILGWLFSLLCEWTSPSVPATILVVVMAWAFPSLLKAMWRNT